MCSVHTCEVPDAVQHSTYVLSMLTKPAVFYYPTHSRTRCVRPFSQLFLERIYCLLWISSLHFLFCIRLLILWFSCSLSLYFFFLYFCLSFFVPFVLTFAIKVKFECVQIIYDKSAWESKNMCTHKCVFGFVTSIYVFLFFAFASASPSYLREYVANWKTESIDICA